MPASRICILKSPPRRRRLQARACPILSTDTAARARAAGMRNCVYTSCPWTRASSPSGKTTANDDEEDTLTQCDSGWMTGQPEVGVSRITCYELKPWRPLEHGVVSSLARLDRNDQKFAGTYPSALAQSADGKRLFVADAST